MSARASSEEISKEDYEAELDELDNEASAMGIDLVDMMNGGKDSGAYSLKIAYSDGTTEILTEARDLTQEQALQYLKDAKSGKLKRNSYIPIRKDTPQVIIDTLAQIGENIENLSLIMQVRKAQQSMSMENPANKSKKHGNNVRKHALTPKEIVDIVNNLDNPNCIIYQTNRRDRDGNKLPNNIAVFVEYNKNGNEGLAVIEFNSNIDSEYIGEEYGDVKYHTVVTAFVPDTMRNGMNFDYAEELLLNPNNIELEIVRKQPTRSATGEKHPNTSSELLSNDSVPQPNKKVNSKNGTDSYSITPKGPSS